MTTAAASRTAMVRYGVRQSAINKGSAATAATPNHGEKTAADGSPGVEVLDCFATVYPPFALRLPPMACVTLESLPVTAR